jgi:hypothetical protein
VRRRRVLDRLDTGRVGAVNMSMATCDNCAAAFDPANQGLVATTSGRQAAAVCGPCLADASLIKLVLRRGQLGGFAYEQYVPLEMRKPTKAAG